MREDAARRRVWPRADALRARRLDLLEQRKLEPSFKLRHTLTERIVLINEIIASTTAALDLMLHYGK